MPTSEDRDRRAADLRERAALVRRDGWAPYESTWSAGEVAGVRAVLGEPGAVEEATEMWATTLWGAGAAEADARTGYQSTRRWFAALRGHCALDVPHKAAEVPAGPVTTAGELRALLEGVPDDVLILTQGYEGGFTTISSATLHEVQQLDRHGEKDYLGRYELIDEAQRQAAEPPGGSPWNPIYDFEPPTLLGEPVTALILTREGR
ncbi:hypothetical protein [Mycobacteroides abscessus]|uniref:hypothetical protein n=1 Tax=Mycobacteroides abscessus TaxID=36809 RepID=UPI00092C2803|nr:hypothetical protein [Mycobacteroides abscessus]SIJ95008.1 Uncharacterised protein [Mycobacteroides abscessus subsp. abscessus]